MKALFRILVMALACWSIFACSSPAPTASVTVNGKTTKLLYAKAWPSGSFFGVPTVEVFFAEKDLGDVNNVADAIVTHDKHGIMLHFDSTPDFSNGAKNTDKVIPYKTGVELLMDWPFMHWSWRPVSESGDSGIQISDLSFSGGVLSGKLAAKGKEVLDEPTDNPTTLNAWSAEFHMPIETPAQK